MENQWMVHVPVEEEQGYTKCHPTFNEALADAKKKALAFTTTAYVFRWYGDEARYILDDGLRIDGGGFGVGVFPLQVERNTD